jgi:hypothetical protein
VVPRSPCARPRRLLLQQLLEQQAAAARTLREQQRQHRLSHALLPAPPAPPAPRRRDSVHIVTDYGRPTGVALVEFASPQEAQVAMSKDKQMMGTRYIEVFVSNRDELQRYLPRCY